ncbi:glycoside hydrolase family 43 protein [Thermostilla marina]
MRHALLPLLVFFCSGVSLSASAPSISNPPAAPDGTQYAGYLFAHMLKSDYGHLYYAISTDGLHWQTLNGGKRILPPEVYRGHPDIARGPDNRFYLVGNYEREPEIRFWVSEDLIHWRSWSTYAPKLDDVPGFRPALFYVGAPKVFYDDAAGRFVLSWHSTIEKPIKEDPEQFWSGMRTLYVTSRDLKSFSTPRRLFTWESAVIDTIIRREGDQYIAFLKDERYPSYAWPTGKTIRIARAPAATGPYTEPSPPITTNFREAPTVIPKLDGTGWFLYYEQYPGKSYGCATAPSLSGPWYELYWQKYSVPEGARHGCMLPLTRKELDRLQAEFGPAE